MPKTKQKILNEFLKQIKEVLGNRIKKIILYGSYARGDYNKTSDIDIMILTDFSDEEIENSEEKLVDIAYEIELNTGIIISPIVRNISIYQQRINFHPFYMNVEKEGVNLYG